VPAPVRFLSCEPILDPLSLGMWVFDRDQADSVMGHPISWVIVGGESGARARPCDVAWIRSVVRQCRESRVPVFVKQLGALPISDSDDDRRHCGDMNLPRPFRLLLRGSGADPAEWPEDLRVREWPHA